MDRGKQRKRNLDARLSERASASRPSLGQGGSPQEKSNINRPETVSRSRAIANGRSPQVKNGQPNRRPITRSRQRVRSRPILSKPVLYAMRLLIFGIGISVIVGIVLSVLSPANREFAGASQTVQQNARRSRIAKVPAPWKLQEPIAPLQTEISTLAAQDTKLKPGVFLIDLDTNNYVDVNADRIFAAASTIKVPVLVAFFQAVDAGKIRLDEELVLKQEHITGGSGELQGYKPGSKYPALEVATKMIVISDNTATNMLIDRLGGLAPLNQEFQAWGLAHTVLNNPLADLEGTNTTTPKDLSKLLALIDKGELISLRSRDRLLHIMRQTKTRSLLPSGLGKAAVMANKTGTLGAMVGDMGLVDMPNGKRYITAVLVERPRNNSKAQELIRQISKTTYQYLAKPAPTPESTSAEKSPKKTTSSQSPQPATSSN